MTTPTSLQAQTDISTSVYTFTHRQGSTYPVYTTQDVQHKTWELLRGDKLSQDKLCKTNQYKVHRGELVLYDVSVEDKERAASVLSLQSTRLLLPAQQ
jgi:hypothetical protein